jgi:hypothetical protein
MAVLSHVRRAWNPKRSIGQDRYEPSGLIGPAGGPMPAVELKIKGED